jgi:hypothetical protein
MLSYVSVTSSPFVSRIAHAELDLFLSTPLILVRWQCKLDQEVVNNAGYYLSDSDATPQVLRSEVVRARLSCNNQKQEWPV